MGYYVMLHCRYTLYNIQSGKFIPTSINFFFIMKASKTYLLGFLVEKQTMH